MKTLSQHIAEKLLVNKTFINYQEKIKEKIKCTNDNIYETVIAEVHKQSCNDQTRLHPIDLNHIDVSEVTEMTCLFDAVNDEVTLRYIDISEWDVSNVDRMKWMFEGCTELVSVGDLSNWDVRKLTDAEGMFKNCKKLQYIGDISKWNPDSIYDLGVTDMFRGCKKLKGNVGDLSKWNISIQALQKLKNQGIV